MTQQAHKPIVRTKNCTGEACRGSEHPMHITGDKTLCNFCITIKYKLDGQWDSMDHRGYVKLFDAEAVVKVLHKLDAVNAELLEVLIEAEATFRQVATGSGIVARELASLREMRAAIAKAKQ